MQRTHLHKKELRVKVDDSLDVMIKAIKNGLLEYGDFHRARRLENLLDDWHYEERKKCSSCQHERNGCQYHDARN